MEEKMVDVYDIDENGDWVETLVPESSFEDDDWE